MRATENDICAQAVIEELNLLRHNADHRVPTAFADIA
jgi:hypothetical protein